MYRVYFVNGAYAEVPVEDLRNLDAETIDHLYDQDARMYLTPREIRRVIEYSQELHEAKEQEKEEFYSCFGLERVA